MKKIFEFLRKMSNEAGGHYIFFLGLISFDFKLNADADTCKSSEVAIVFPDLRYDINTRVSLFMIKLESSASR